MAHVSNMPEHPVVVDDLVPAVARISETIHEDPLTPEHYLELVRQYVCDAVGDGDSLEELFGWLADEAAMAVYCGACVLQRAVRAKRARVSSCHKKGHLRHGDQC